LRGSDRFSGRGGHSCYSECEADICGWKQTRSRKEILYISIYKKGERRQEEESTGKGRQGLGSMGWGTSSLPWRRSRSSQWLDICRMWATVSGPKRRAIISR